MTTAINFNANDVPPRTGFEPVPNGDYRAMIVNSEVKPTKAGNGRYLQLDWQILDGEHKGRVIFDRLNVDNPNATAQKIGQESLSAVCHATGVMKLTDAKALHNIPVMLKVRVSQKDKNEDPQNEIKRYTAIAGAAPVANGAPAPTSTATPAAAAPAWATKKV